MAIGSSLAGYKFKRAARLSGVQRAPEGSRDARQAPLKERVALTVEVGAEEKRRFVLGVHAIDDATRYVG